MPGCFTSKPQVAPISGFSLQLKPKNSVRFKTAHHPLASVTN